MIDSDRYCMDIVNQLAAAESLLHKARQEVLRAHLECCVRGLCNASRAVRTHHAFNRNRFFHACFFLSFFCFVYCFYCFSGLRRRTLGVQRPE